MQDPNNTWLKSSVTAEQPVPAFSCRAFSLKALWQVAVVAAHDIIQLPREDADHPDRLKLHHFGLQLVILGLCLLIFATTYEWSWVVFFFLFFYMT